MQSYKGTKQTQELGVTTQFLPFKVMKPTHVLTNLSTLYVRFTNLQILFQYYNHKGYCKHFVGLSFSL